MNDSSDLSYLKYVNDSARVKILQDLIKWLEQRDNIDNEEIIKTILTTMGLPSDIDIFSMINSTSLDIDGNELLTESILMMQWIDSLGNIKIKTKETFRKRVLESFTLAYHKDKIKRSHIMLNSLIGLTKATGRLEEVAIPTNAFKKQKNTIKAIGKNMEHESNY